ncbi:COG4223 family protein [Paracoccus alkenifer]|uniref:Inner membrane protein n=1 Tax=Paracoccus alkenifer TaxID=65735 RepID=A0A1H6LDQ9_9RHOB|nr:hypothetical protein [Paracoccus alkenifer]SEH84180.1 hypothetical protein SAMN04488075_1377 [Paracoccus alkenifer]
MTKRPDAAPTSETPATAAARGTLVPSHPTGDGRNAAAAPREPSPPIESTLVGDGGTLDAMAPRPSAAKDAPLRLEPAMGSSVPPVAQRKNGSEASGVSDGDEKDSDGKDGDTPPSHDPEPPFQPQPASPTAPPVPPVVPAPPPAPAPGRGGFAPMVLGGIIAAGLGAGAAWFVIPRLPAQLQPAASAPAADPAAVTEAARAAASDAVSAAVQDEFARSGAEIESRAIAAARQAAAEAAATAADAGLAQAVDGDALLEQARQAGAEAATQLLAQAPADTGADPSVQTALAAQAQRLAALDQAVEELRAQPRDPAETAAPTGIETQVSALEQRLEEQAATLESLAGRASVDPAALERLAADAEAATARITAAAEQAEARLAQAESRADELAAAAEQAARRARASSAAVALAEALQTGAPRQQALGALAEAGVEPSPALTGDLPSPDGLATGFAPAARAALRDARAAEPAQGAGRAIGNFLRAQTGARSVAPREGTDADAVLSRAGDAVQRGAFAQALDELATLPEPARPAMAEWTAQAQRFVAAQQALGAMIAPDAAPAHDPAPDDSAPDAPGTALPPAPPSDMPAPAAAAPSN